MGYDPRSAAVIVLCIGAVLAAAVLFPAAGLDGRPTDGDGGLSERQVSDGSSTDDGPGSDGTNDGTGETDGETGSGGTESDADEGDERRGDPSEEESAGERTNEEPAPDSPAGNSVGPIALVLVALLLVFGAAYAMTKCDFPDLTGRSDDETLQLPDGPLPQLRVHLARIPRFTMIATISLARRSTSLGSGLVTVGRAAAGAGRLVGAGVATALGSVASVSIVVPSLPRPRFPSIGWPRSDDGGNGSENRMQSNTPSDGGSAGAGRDGYAEPETVEEAWRRLVASLPLRRPSVRTPRECATIAIDAGRPREAVETVTEAFEAVRYGGAARTPARLERVRAAYERLREGGGDGR